MLGMFLHLYFLLVLSGIFSPLLSAEDSWKDETRCNNRSEEEKFPFKFLKIQEKTMGDSVLVSVTYKTSLDIVAVDFLDVTWTMRNFPNVRVVTLNEQKRKYRASVIIPKSDPALVKFVGFLASSPPMVYGMSISLAQRNRSTNNLDFIPHFLTYPDREIISEENQRPKFRIISLARSYSWAGASYFVLNEKNGTTDIWSNEYHDFSNNGGTCPNREITPFSYHKYGIIIARYRPYSSSSPQRLDRLAESYKMIKVHPEGDDSFFPQGFVDVEAHARFIYDEIRIEGAQKQIKQHCLIGSTECEIIFDIYGKYSDVESFRIVKMENGIAQEELSPVDISRDPFDYKSVARATYHSEDLGPRTEEIRAILTGKDGTVKTKDMEIVHGTFPVPTEESGIEQVGPNRYKVTCVAEGSPAPTPKVQFINLQAREIEFDWDYTTTNGVHRIEKEYQVFSGKNQFYCMFQGFGPEALVYEYSVWI